MVKKFVYGTPFETEAVVKEIPSSEGNPDYGTFFDSAPLTQSIANGNGSAASIYGNATVGVMTDKDKEIEHLKQLLEEKERTIQILMNR